MTKCREIEAHNEASNLTISRTSLDFKLIPNSNQPNVFFFFFAKKIRKILLSRNAIIKRCLRIERESGELKKLRKYTSPPPMDYGGISFFSNHTIL